jgi:hypothetical protein
MSLLLYFAFRLFILLSKFFYLLFLLPQHFIISSFISRNEPEREAHKTTEEKSDSKCFFFRAKVVFVNAAFWMKLKVSSCNLSPPRTTMLSFHTQFHSRESSITDMLRINRSSHGRIRENFSSSLLLSSLLYGLSECQGHKNNSTLA